MAGSVPHPAGDRNGRRGTGNRGIGGWVSSGRGKNGRQMTGASGAERKSRNSTPYTRRVGTGSALRNTRHRGGRDRRGAGVRGGAFAKPGKQPHAPEGTAGRETKSYNNPMHPKGGGPSRYVRPEVRPDARPDVRPGIRPVPFPRFPVSMSPAPFAGPTDPVHAERCVLRVEAGDPDIALTGQDTTEKNKKRTLG